MKVFEKVSGTLVLVAGVILASRCSIQKNIEKYEQERIHSLNSSASAIWRVKAQQDVGADSINLFNPDYASGTWANARVPGTVFASYVEAGLEKDPNYGDNIYQVDKSKYDRNFWYRTVFSVPEHFDPAGKIWLNFEGINRKGEIFLNGVKLGLLDGFMHRGKFDITSYVAKGGKNVLVVLAHWPEPPIPNYASPTYISSAGWDWMPYVPGLEMGITDDVYLSNTGSVTLNDPWIRTDLVSSSQADLSVQVEVKNHAGETRKGNLKGMINPGAIEFSMDVELQPGETKTLFIDKQVAPQLSVEDPRLWWPNGYGDPNLYTCDLQFLADQQVSDTRHITFGVREYAYDSTGGMLNVSVNGERIFLKGGNWGMSEYMLRCRGDEYDTKLRLHKEMNFNMIRNWIGSITDEEFYAACDRYGMMVWDDFWLNSHPNLPKDIETFKHNAVEKIKRYRNYACIALWCGDNESTPLEPANTLLRVAVEKHDGNDRRYQPNSRAGGGLSGSGPWTNFEPQRYFTGVGGFGGDEGQHIGLRSELGTAVFTSFESFRKFMPKEHWWPRNEMWNKHFFGPSAANAGPDNYEKSINERYGKATDIEDFCRKAQLLNIETNKAMFEGWQDNMWEKSSGLLIWMSQSAYPSFVWQTYDYYYDLNGAYWGAKKACEPLHIQWNVADNTVKVINNTRDDLSGLVAEATVYNKQGEAIEGLGETITLDVEKVSAKTALKINFGMDNLAAGKQVVASSVSADAQTASAAADVNYGTRWSSAYKDHEWIYVDLETEQQINSIRLYWEAAHAKAYTLQVSSDAIHWKDVYTTDHADGNIDQIRFDPTKARYVRVSGIKRATQWGYSLWEMEVYGSNRKPLSDVHFVKLTLKDRKGNLVSDNFYWRGDIPLDYTGLNTLAAVDLEVKSSDVTEDGTYRVNATITNPASSSSVAFAIHVKLVNPKTMEQLLPVFMTDNYFSLLPGETRAIQLEVNAGMVNEKPLLVVEPYNNRIDQ